MEDTEEGSWASPSALPAPPALQGRAGQRLGIWHVLIPGKQKGLYVFRWRCVKGHIPGL